MEPSDVPDANATVLYVGNLDKRVTDQMMINILRTGLQHIKEKILSSNMFQSADMSNPEGYCFVQCADNDSACQALTFLNGREFCGKKVKVSWATNSSTGVPKVLGTSVSIYVGNLDDNIDESDLKAAFDPFGEILNAKIVRDPTTNRSKNIGFISYTNKPDAERAIRDMQGAVLKGRAIKTNWASRNQTHRRGLCALIVKPSLEGPNQVERVAFLKDILTDPAGYNLNEHDYDEVYKSSPEDNCTIYVGGIPNHATDEMMRHHFQDYGTILELRIFAAKNYAFMKYDSHAAAATAICKTNGSEVSGSCLKVWWGKDGPDNSGGGGYRNNHHSNSAAQDHQDYSQYNSYGGMSQGNPEQQYAMQQYMQYYNYWMQHYQQMQMQQIQGGYPYASYQQSSPQQQQQQQRGTYGQQPQAQQQQKTPKQQQRNYNYES